VHEALCDNFDTPRAVNDLFLLVKETNKYMQQKTDQIKMPLVLQVSRYIFKIMKIFGIYKDGDFPDVSGGSNDELTA
jgi:cysteinyl-tRNA synthetase